MSFVCFRSRFQGARRKRRIRRLLTSSCTINPGMLGLEFCKNVFIVRLTHELCTFCVKYNPKPLKNKESLYTYLQQLNNVLAVLYYFQNIISQMVTVAL